MVLKKCEDIKAVLKLTYREEYEEYLTQLEAKKQEEEALAQQLEQQRIAQEEERLKQETAE